MRKLLYLLLPTLLLGTLEAARACSERYPPRSDADLFAKASAVFVAHIVRADEVRMRHSDDDSGEPAVEATFRLVEVLKGQPPADGKVRGSIPHKCTRSLLVGLEYVIFLDEGDILWAKDEGTRPLFDMPNSPDKWCHHKRCQLEKLREIARRAP